MDKIEHIDQIGCASFRTAVLAERDWTRERIDYLLRENETRRRDLEKAWFRLFGGVMALAMAACGMLVTIFKAKVGL